MKKPGAAGLVAAAALLIGAPPAFGQQTMGWAGRSWNVYDGSGLLGQRWSPERVTVGRKHPYLHVQVRHGVTGGVSMRLARLTGRWSVTFRMSRGPGKYAIMLWPESGPRPELDFAEDVPYDPMRRWCTATWHPAVGSKLHTQTDGRFDVWHTATIIVRGTRARVYLDGQLRATWPAPGVRVRLAIQTADLTGAAGRSTLVVRSASSTPLQSGTG